MACDTDPCGEASHLRAGLPDGPTGVGKKSDDRFALPLCPVCHRRSHELGERRYWGKLRLDQYAICDTLRMCNGIEAMRAAVFDARQHRRK